MLNQPAADYRGPALPPTATAAFRFYRGNDIVLYYQGEVYDGDLIEPERWHQIAPGLRVFVRLPGPLETATIVHALVLGNELGAIATASDEGHVLRLDLHPDRPAGEAPGEGEVVAWHRAQFRTLFVYWERAGRRRGPQRES